MKFTIRYDIAVFHNRDFSLEQWHFIYPSLYLIAHTGFSSRYEMTRCLLWRRGIFDDNDEERDSSDRAQHRSHVCEMLMAHGVITD